MYGRKDYICIGLIGLVFAIVGIGICISQSKKLLTVSAVKTWDTVPAKIVSVSVDKKPSKLHVKYQYTYKGIEYENIKIHPAFPEGSKYSKDNSILFKTIRNIQTQNKSIAVHVNPVAPENSYMVAGILPNSFVGLIMSLPVLLIGIGILIFSITKIRQFLPYGRVKNIDYISRLLERERVNVYQH